MARSEGLIGFRVDRAEFNYFAWFKTPLLGLLGVGTPSVFSAVLRAFDKYGVRLADIKLDGPSVNPADVQVSCYILASGVMVRFRLEHVQVVCDRPGQLGREGLAGLVAATMSVVREVASATAVASHTLSAGLHGRLVEESLQSRLNALVPTALSGTPEFLPSGVAFARSRPDQQGEESVVLERSVTAQEGAFLKVTAVYPGSVAEPAALERSLAFFDEVTDRLKLEVDWGQ